uniref:RING-type domain-containing protein n=1 Tax=Panagrellus redivivus TaxID=6233 RepID=A0A7E4V9E7_PANRE
MGAGLEFRLDSLHLKCDSSDNASRSTDDDIVVVQKDNNLLEMCQCSICFERYTNAIRAPITMQCGHTFCKTCISKLITGKLFRCVVCQTVSIIGFGPLNKNIILTEILHKFGLLEPDPDAPVYTPPKTTSKLPENILEGMDTSKMAEYSEFFLSVIHLFLRTKSRKLRIFGSCQHIVDKINSIKAAISQWFVNAATSAPAVDRRRPIFSLEARITDNNPDPAPSSSENARFRRINGSNLYRPTNSLFADEVHSMYRQVASEGSRMNQREHRVGDNHIMYRLLGCMCPARRIMAQYRYQCQCTNCSPDCILHQPL